MSESNLMTIEQVAERLQVTRRTVYSWISAGRLAVVRLSRRATRVRPEDLAAFLAQAAERRPS